tara:strand:+ start:179 stop:412 length:234 start_codon:yes stop_codon:yes gene_type:complete
MKIIQNKSDIPTLKEAQQYIGGYVERLILPNGDVLLFDEDGKEKGLQANIKASELATVTIVGKAILIPKSLKSKKWG